MMGYVINFGKSIVLLKLAEIYFLIPPNLPLEKGGVVT